MPLTTLKYLNLSNKEHLIRQAPKHPLRLPVFGALLIQYILLPVLV